MLQDLGRHVGQRSANRLRQSANALSRFQRIGSSESPGDPEIEDLHPVRGREHNVFRLDVAVDNPLLMSRVQTLGTLDSNGQELGETARLRLDAPPQSSAFDVLHHEKDFALVFEHVINRGNVRMVQRRGALGFLQKSLSVLVILELRGHPLDGYDSLQGRVLRAEHLSHAAGTKPIFYAETSDGAARQVRGLVPCWAGSNRGRFKGVVWICHWPVSRARSCSRVRI